MKSVLRLNSSLALLIFSTLLLSIVGCGVKKPPIAKGANPMAYEKYIKKSKDNKYNKEKN